MMIKKIFITLFIIGISFNAKAETKTAHIIVALCDNIHQGIYPVPDKLGRGNDPENNLYWGAMYGTFTYLKNSKEWSLIKHEKDVNKNILRRAVFKHKNTDTYIVADAYLGKKIKTATEDFLAFSAGQNPQTIIINDYKLNIGGNANLIAYVGHNGLMDFSTSENYKPQDEKRREVIILACYSKRYFKDLINHINATPILWTNGKLAPEGYIIKAALDSWAIGKISNIRENASLAYAKYQKISKKAALNLFDDKL